MVLFVFNRIKVSGAVGVTDLLLIVNAVQVLLRAGLDLDDLSNRPTIIK